MAAGPDPALSQRIITQVPDGVIFADREGVIRLWNGGAEAIFGHKAEEALGQSLDLIIPERFRDAHWKGFDAALARGTSKYGREALVSRSIRKDGASIYVELAFAVLKDDRGQAQGAVATVRDVTARYNQERTMRQRLAELEKQAKGQATA